MAADGVPAQGGRVVGRRFLERVSLAADVPYDVVESVWDTALDELIVALMHDESVVITRFGKFYRQAHKGHKVRFGPGSVDDYSVLKFSATRSVNQRLTDGCSVTTSS